MKVTSPQVPHPKRGLVSPTVQYCEHIEEKISPKNSLLKICTLYTLNSHYPLHYRLVDRRTEHRTQTDKLIPIAGLTLFDMGVLEVFLLSYTHMKTWSETTHLVRTTSDLKEVLI